MSKQGNGSLTLNFIMNMILTVSSLVFPLITFPYVSRVLLAEGNGKIQLATALISYFVMFSQLGLPSYGVRACAVVRSDRRRLTKTVHELFLINAIMTLLSYGVLFFLVGSLPRLRQEKLLYLVSSGAIILNTLGMEWLFKAMEEYRYITIRSVLMKLVSVVAMFILIRSEGDYVRYAGISVLAAYGSNLLNLPRLHRFIDLRPLEHYDLRPHIKPLVIFFAMSCTAAIYTNLDSVMLGFLSTDAQVGYYGVAVKVKNILVSIVTALGTVLLPRVSSYYEQGLLKEFRRLIVKALHFVLLISIPLALYFMIFASPSILFLSGDTYGPSVAPMIAIIPTLVFIGITNVLGMQIMVPTGKEKQLLGSTIGGAVTDLVLNALLIPSMGALGAAIGTLGAEAMVLAIQYWALRGAVRTFFRQIPFLKIFLACGAACLSCFWITGMGWGPFPILALSAFLFFGVYLLVLYFLREPLVQTLRTRLAALRKSSDLKNRS